MKLLAQITELPGRIASALKVHVEAQVKLRAVERERDRLKADLPATLTALADVRAQLEAAKAESAALTKEHAALMAKSKSFDQDVDEMVRQRCEAIGCVDPVWTPKNPNR